MTGPKPPVHVELVWTENLKFGSKAGDAALVVDADGVAGPSPVQLLGVALVSCMAADVVDILRKGRHPLSRFRATLTGDRAPDPPRRLLGIQLHFAIHGAVPAGAVERAIALSRDKYCSVWHSLRPDIQLTTAFDVFD